MDSRSEESAPVRRRRVRIGVLSHMDQVSDPALQFVVLQLNVVQSSFEFEFVPFEQADPMLVMLAPGSVVDRSTVRDSCHSFLERWHELWSDNNLGFGTGEAPPDRLVVLTTARFADNHYSARRGRVSVIALGNWRREMAPPSILEFVITLLIREAIATVSRRLSGSVHLGTKGCPCDVTPVLADARQKALSKYLCDYCRAALEDDGLLDAVADIERMLDKSWLGSPDDRSSPASIAAALGHDLFVVKGLRPTFRENVRTVLRQEGLKQFLAITGSVVVALLLVLLGLPR